MQLKSYFFEVILFDSCIFLVRGIVDKMKEMTNNKVIATKLQNVKLDISSSPKETVKYIIIFK